MTQAERALVKALLRVVLENAGKTTCGELTRLQDLADAAGFRGPYKWR